MKTKSKEILPRFSSLVEVLDDPKCAEKIEARLTSIRLARSSALAGAKKGTKLKRGPWDQLQDMGILHAQGLIDEFKLIDQHESSLSSNSRKMVSEICLQCMQETILYWQKIDEAPETKKPKSRKKVATEVIAE